VPPDLARKRPISSFTVDRALAGALGSVTLIMRLLGADGSHRQHLFRAGRRCLETGLTMERRISASMSSSPPRTELSPPRATRTPRARMRATGDDADLSCVAERGMTVCHNPSSNLRLKSGLGVRSRDSRERTVPIGTPGTREVFCLGIAARYRGVRQALFVIGHCFSLTF
jgi:hypothetical protein